MDAALAEALEPVLADLKHSGGPVPRIEDREWSDTDGYSSAMLFGPDGSGQGISAAGAVPLVERIATVADQVQEWAVEALWLAGRPATWPECPLHPDSHPLTAVARNERASWTCPVSGQVISGIGQHEADAVTSKRRQRGRHR